MSENRAIVAETADRLFANLREASFADGWPAIAETGFATLLIPADRGGFGGDHGDFAEVMRLAGRHALPFPVGETIVATALIAAADLAVPDGIVGLATSIGSMDARSGLEATFARVPWGRHLTHLAAVDRGRLLLVSLAGAAIDPGTNPAGEPRDTVRVEAAAYDAGSIAGSSEALAMLMRVAQMAGALDAALALAIDHANQRSQFGRPLAKFQAVQQQLAILATESAAVNSAAAAAALALDAGGHGDHAALELLAAKLRANRAAASGIAIAHQVHGAIGFTAEYPLHRLTRRLMAWRSEMGNDRAIEERLGAMAMALGGRGLWAEMTRRADRGRGE